MSQGHRFTRVLSQVSYVVKAIWIFFPGILFLLLGLFLFLKLPQGKDIIYQSTDARFSWLTGVYLVLAAVFWVFTTWYTARLIAYDRNDIYKKAPAILFHSPRLLGFGIFLVLWLGVFLIDDIDGKNKGWAWLAVLADLVGYGCFHLFVKSSLKKVLDARRRRTLVIIRIGVRLLNTIACTAVVIGWGYGSVNILLYAIPVLQFGFLFLVIVRFPLYQSNPNRPVGAASVKTVAGKKLSRWQRYFNWSFKTAFRGFHIEFEKPVFIVYHLLAAAALLCYLLSINSLSFARELTSFPLVLLSFGILLGIINILSLLSRRNKININFLIFFVIGVMGWLFESHDVKLIDWKVPGSTAYGQRPGFERYLRDWISWHKDSLDKDTAGEYPVFFTLADGGASRSGYWVASVLAYLHERTRYGDSSYHSYFMDHMFCLSGASGGSVGNATFLAAYSLQQKDPALKTDTLCKGYLGNDFLVYPLARILGPDLVKPAFGWLKFWGDRAAALEYGMEHPSPSDSLMGRVMRSSFTTMIPTGQNHFPVLSINTTRVNDGSPGVLSTIIDSSKKIFGARIDVLSLVPPKNDMRLSTVMVLGARFPYMSPGGKLGDNNYFVDGGYFDNSGTGVVHEMLLELEKLKKDTSDRLLQHYLLKMQFYVIHLSNTPITDSVPRQEKRIHPALNDLATPLLTLAGSYNSQTNINDARLTNYLRELNGQRNSYIIYNLYTPGRKENISMNWVISNKARDTMNARLAERVNVDTLARRMRSNQVKDLFRGLIVDQNKAN